MCKKNAGLLHLLSYDSPTTARDFSAVSDVAVGGIVILAFKQQLLFVSRIVYPGAVVEGQRVPIGISVGCRMFSDLKVHSL